MNKAASSESSSHASSAPNLVERLRDERSRRVVFVSHCLLDQNTRYLGGARFPGVVPSVVERYARDGVGLCQMPCPEREVWGGVLKRHLLRFYGARVFGADGLSRLLLPLLRSYTKHRYARIARRVADEIEDYVRSGFDVLGVVGVGDSPSCGVRHTLGLKRALPLVMQLDLETIDAPTFNERVVRACITHGEGWYVAELKRQLARRGIDVPFLEYDPLRDLVS